MPRSTSSSTSRSLLRRVQLQDEAAWERLSLIYAPTVYAWCRKANLQAADSADIVQEVFQSVAIHIKNFQSDKPGSTFRGWLWTIYRSKLMDFYRRCPLPGAGSAVERVTALHESSSSDDDQQRAERAQLVNRALRIIKGDFRQRTWDAFWRTTMLSEPVKEVAEKLGLSSAAVCMCRSRVLRRLRETLEGLDIISSEL